MSNLKNKPMGSIRNRNKSQDTEHFEDGALLSKSSKNIAIPSNHTPTTNRRIKDDDLFKSTITPSKKRKSLNHSVGKRQLPINTLRPNLNLNSQKENKKIVKKSKKDTDIFNLPDIQENNGGILFPDLNYMDSVMKEFDIDEMQQRTEELKNKLDNQEIDLKKKKENKKEKNSIVSQYISEHLTKDTLLDMELLSKPNSISNSITSSHKNNPEKKDKKHDISLDNLLNNKDRANEVIKKHSGKGKTFIRKDLIKTLEDIRILVKKYRKVLVDILNGEIGSFFYTEAKVLQQSSPMMSIKGDEIHNLPKHRFYGYIGAVRGFHIGKMIENDSFLNELLREKMRYSDVIKFWGINNFSQYVLAPELIAHLILDEGKLEDLDEAYDIMEDTNDYGMFVTNIKDIEGKYSIGETVDLDSDIEEIDPTEEIKNVKQVRNNDGKKEFKKKVVNPKTTEKSIVSNESTKSLTTSAIKVDCDSDSDSDNDIDNSNSLLGDIFG
ncbi:Restriction of telomere capping protein 4 [Pichia californica]|uniref:Restriction of telomere capping protein 4 n=1 Tax=Pichia californica TaxID=460514 RepID=A0A9P6WRI9_9ASCO|nr:Restriction of telomere capping protein 4 [[Candida] californica]KAG0691013.1 Restriction of telomere capping protein 4 [[Candida] californica]